MIACDSSTLIAYIQDDPGPDTDLLDANLGAGEVAISPVVLAEILSEPRLPREHAAFIEAFPLLDFQDGFWVRVARARAALSSRKLRARLADAMIAQAAIDHRISLITRDADFRHYAKHCGLKLAV